MNAGMSAFFCGIKLTPLEAPIDRIKSINQPHLLLIITITIFIFMPRWESSVLILAGFAYACICAVIEIKTRDENQKFREEINEEIKSIKSKMDAIQMSKLMR